MNLKNAINIFRNSDQLWISLTRDILTVILAVLIFAFLSQIVFGMWAPMVAVESGSMEPHMNIGDIVFIENIDRTVVITNQPDNENYSSFKNSGDVILYRPYGKKDVTPIIHRAMYYVQKGEPMWTGGPPAPSSGYITKGDNLVTNTHFDQQGTISYHIPVKDEWIIGIARYRIPYVGYIRLLLPKF
ncbi:MAG TPA: S26 family signal peptidase [Methanosarcinaceae archaeon]|nr:S26 family signal peptidase [Methanosarcinaceae archaeon]